MENEKILNSGFVKAFIEEYYNDKNYSFYPDRDRLNYSLCNTNEEKLEYTTEQLIETKKLIKNLGFEELSYAHILSTNPDSINFIETNKSFDFWLDRFGSHFIDDNNTFTPITDYVLMYFEKDELDVECFENEEDFWEFYPSYLCPEIKILHPIVLQENDIISQINFEIDEYRIDETWEFNYDRYQKSREYIKPIDDLLKLSELFVQLNRFQMLKEFSEIREETPILHNNSLKTFITKLSTQEYSLSEALKEVKFNYPDEHLLRIFVGEFITEVEGIFLELLLRLTDIDILKVIRFYNSVLKETIPTIGISKDEYSYIKGFIREIEGYKVVSNVKNFKYDNSKEIQLIYLDQIFRYNSMYAVMGNLSITEDYENLKFLWHLEEELKTYQIPNKSEGSREPVNESSIGSVKQDKLLFLEKIWLPDAKISVENLLKLGIDKGIWTEDYIIKVQKGSLYGTGKTLLGSLAIALKGYSISENTDYKMQGKAFCAFFNIPVKKTTNNPYKAFSSGNEKIIRAFKTQFNIK